MSIVKLFKANRTFEQRNGKFIFNEMEKSDIEDELDGLKHYLKKYPSFYQFLINWVSPVYVDKQLSQFLSTYVNESKVALNIGSGNTSVSKQVTNLDIFAYDNVDIVCSIDDLPFEDNTVDVILNIAVLEHVPAPENVVSEIYRVLKPEGVVYTAFPFIQGFHASPYDFTRVTEEGIKVLHKDFSDVDVTLFGGPTSGFLWVFQEWLAIILSFGSKRLHMIWYVLLLVILSPLKWLDVLFIHHPMAKNISSGFIYTGKKPKIKD